MKRSIMFVIAAYWSIAMIVLLFSGQNLQQPSVTGNQDIYFDQFLTPPQITAVRNGGVNNCTNTFDSGPILQMLEAMNPLGSGASGPQYGTPGPRIVFGAGCYPFRAAYSVTHAVSLIGVGPGGSAGGPTYGTYLQFPQNSAGFYFDNQCTSFGMNVTCYAGPGGSNASTGARVEGIQIDGNTTMAQSNGVNPGVFLSTAVSFDRVKISNFDGTCLDITGNTANSNSDGFLFANSQIFGCGAYGIHTHGGDANVGIVDHVIIHNTVGACLLDNAFLSNTWSSVNTAACDGIDWYQTVNSGYTSLVSANAVATFTGSLAAGVLTVTALTGTIPVPSSFNSSSPAVPGNTITSQLTGPAGGAGTYQTNATGTSFAAQPMTIPHVYQCLSETACSTTAPVVNGQSTWLELGVNTGDVAPAWSSGYAKYLVGGPFQHHNANSESVFLSTYCEGQNTVSVVDPPALLIGGNQCPAATTGWMTTSGGPTGVSFQASTGWSAYSPNIAPGPCGNTSVGVGIGGYANVTGYAPPQGIFSAMTNGCDQAGGSNATWNWRFNFPSYTDICWGPGIGSQEPVFCATGFTTANSFGRGATETLAIPYFPLGVAFTDGISGRIVTQAAAAPTSGLHAAGEIVWNNNPTGVGSVIAWVNTVMGTPGTWIALYASNAVGVSCAATTVSLTTLTVTNGVVTHC